MLFRTVKTQGSCTTQRPRVILSVDKLTLGTPYVNTSRISSPFPGEMTYRNSTSRVWSKYDLSNHVQVHPSSYRGAHLLQPSLRGDETPPEPRGIEKSKSAQGSPGQYLCDVTKGWMVRATHSVDHL